MIVVLLLACAGDPRDSEQPRDTAATLELPPGCPSEPCAPDLAIATWRNDEPLAAAGVALALWDDTLLVGKPGAQADGTPLPAVDLLHAPTLEYTGRFRGQSLDWTGQSLAVADIDGDGEPEVAIGQPNDADGPDQHGSVVLLHGLPEGEVEIVGAAQLTFFSGQYVYAGLQVAFAATGPTSAVELLASGDGNVAEDGGRLYALDPGATGLLGEEDALRTIRGGQGFGIDFTTWDGDGDGQVDIVAVLSGCEVGWFQGPWVGDRVEDDADAAWTPRDPAVQEDWGDDLGSPLEPVGDLDGDGLDDLAIAAAAYGDPEMRAGRVYVVPAGQLQPGPADDIVTQVRGSELGEGVGYGVGGGDIDGDGQGDLIVGASGVWPGEDVGKLLVFLGPIAGVLASEDAAAVVYGEYAYDYFGRTIVALDADGDDQDDLAVAAYGWPVGTYNGAVYLFAGADLLP